MNNRTDQESLLTEVLAEASPAEFRAAMLAETLRLARRRRQFRQARQVVVVVAVMSLLAVFVAQQFSKPTVVSLPLAEKIGQRSYTLIHTQPMPASALIRTRSFFAAGLAATIPSVMEVVTVSGGFRLINDDELLALLADQPAVLIRTGPNSEELVFANPEDQKRVRLY